MRETLADICDEEIQSDNPSCYTLADAIIVALPDMVKPLVWDDHPISGEPVLSRAKVQGGAYFICDDTDDFTGFYLDFVSCDNIKWWQHVRSTSVVLHDCLHNDDVTPLKAAAQAHHVAQVLSAFGITPTIGGQEP